MLGQMAMHASVGLLQGVGIERVEALVTANSLTLSTGLTDIAGIELVRPFDTHRVSGIVSFMTPARDLVEIHRSLMRKQLVCALRGEAIRLSPHFYQSARVMQKMLTVIEDVM